MASIISYLENYIETTIGLPSDLSRYLNLIKVLDERTTELMEAIKHTTDALCNMQPIGSKKGSVEEQVRLQDVKISVISSSVGSPAQSLFGMHCRSICVS